MNIFRNIFLFFILIFCGFFCFVLANQKVLDAILEKFSVEETPGLSETIQSNNSGKWFELESALCLQDHYGQRIKGFSLDIDFLMPSNEQMFGRIGKEIFELRTTEYDIVTKDEFVYECKVYENPTNFFSEAHYKKMKNQFKKEKTLLRWFTCLQEQLEAKKVHLNCIFNGKNKSLLMVNGPLTFFKDVYFSSKWVSGETISECNKKWIKVIKVLSDKSLLILFKNSINDILDEKLRAKGFEYIAGINYFDE